MAIASTAEKGPGSNEVVKDPADHGRGSAPSSKSALTTEDELCIAFAKLGLKHTLLSAPVHKISTFKCYPQNGKRKRQDADRSLMRKRRYIEDDENEGDAGYNPNAERSTDPGDKEPHALLGLPQEIQDIIFDFAYSRVDGFHMITMPSWHDKERRRWRENRAAYSPRSFPSSKVCEWLVSKKFFLSAARAYLGNQIVDTGRGDSSWMLLQLTFGKIGTLSLFGAFLTHLRCEFRWCHRLYRLPNLRVLELQFDKAFFDTLEPKFAWEDVLHPHDLVRAIRNHDLHRFSTRTTITLSGTCYSANTAQKQAIWQVNRAKFEEILRFFARRPPASTADDAVYMSRTVSICKAFESISCRLLGPATAFQSEVHMLLDRRGQSTAEALADHALQRMGGWDPYRLNVTRVKSVAMFSGFKRVEDHDVPNTSDGLTTLVLENGEGLLEWIGRKKQWERSLLQECKTLHDRVRQMAQ